MFRAIPCFRRLLLPAVLLTIGGLFAGSAIAKLSQYLPKDSATGYTVKALKMGEGRTSGPQFLAVIPAAVKYSPDSFRQEAAAVPEAPRPRAKSLRWSCGLRSPPAPASL